MTESRRRREYHKLHLASKTFFFHKKKICRYYTSIPRIYHKSINKLIHSHQVYPYFYYKSTTKFDISIYSFGQNTAIFIKKIDSERSYD